MLYMDTASSVWDGDLCQSTNKTALPPCAREQQLGAPSRYRKSAKNLSVAASCTMAMVLLLAQSRSVHAWMRPVTPPRRHLLHKNSNHKGLTSRNAQWILQATNSQQLRWIEEQQQQEQQQQQQQQKQSDGQPFLWWQAAAEPAAHTAVVATSNELNAYFRQMTTAVGSTPVWVPSPLSTLPMLQATHDSTTSIRTFTSKIVGEVGGEDHESSSSPSVEPKEGYGASLVLTSEEKELFALLRRVRKDMNLSTTLRVAGGWVRDKLLATEEFQPAAWVGNNVAMNNGNAGKGPGTNKVAGIRLTSKFQRRVSLRGGPTGSSIGRQGTKILTANHPLKQPVDIDIALDDMLGREFADRLNEYLCAQGEPTHSVGVVLKNPEKSKHLETATMKVGSFWIDFVNLRAEEYTQDSRIPDMMRIGTPSEDAFRRDLTINALFYNINTGEVEDWTGRGFEDLRRGIVATPLPPLTTLLDDPLRVLRSVRFAARLQFAMADDLVEAAQDPEVRRALDQKVSRERVGGEVELMLRSADPVRAMRLLQELSLSDTVFTKVFTDSICRDGLHLLTTAHEHLADCKWSPPVWCAKSVVQSKAETRLLDDVEARRLLWYSSFLKPLWDEECKKKQAICDAAPPGAKPKKASKKANRKSAVMTLLVEDLKRPVKDAENLEKILRAADEISQLMRAGEDVSATLVLMNDIHINHLPQTAACDGPGVQVTASMNGQILDSATPLTELDPVWAHVMDFRWTCAQILDRIGTLWRAALFLSLSEELASVGSDGVIEDAHDQALIDSLLNENEGEIRRNILERYDALASAWQRLGLIGVWNVKPLLDGGSIKRDVLPAIPRGPAFKTVMDEQTKWMVRHPGADVNALKQHLQQFFPDYAIRGDAEE